MTRSDQITQFLKTHGFAKAVRQPLGSDASFRRYERIVNGDTSWMLMDAPPPQEDVRPFIHVTRLLQNYDVSAPKIVAEDAELGFLLLEDFGDISYTKLLKEFPEQEETLYLAAVEALLHIHEQAAGQAIALPHYDDSALLREITVCTDWYLPQVVGDKAESLKTELLDIWANILEGAGLRHQLPVLRDFHADNLMWLPQRAGVHRVGLLDYQDALLGDAAYDMVSFLEDARRDVSPETVRAVLRAYLKGSGESEEAFMRRYAILGAQRNTKILGIFARLCARDGKAHYLHYLPRVWRLLEQDLQHPALAELKHWMDKHIPADVRGVIEVDHSVRALA